jgi:DNA-binding PadR family transcriptional regulator
MQNTTFLILTALADGESDSGDLLARIRTLSGEDGPSLATFYRRLKDGLDQGWLEVVDVGVGAGPGRPGQIYRLTERGRAAARVEARRWRELSDRLLSGEGSAG